MRPKLAAFASGLAAVACIVGGVAVAGPASADTPATVNAPADDTIVDVTSANYQQVMDMSKTKPVVLDFTATWCHWCQEEKPYLQQYHDADNGKWIWARVDVDQNKDLESKYSVDGIPDLINISGGQEKGSRFQGFDPSSGGPDQLRTWLSNL